MLKIFDQNKNPLGYIAKYCDLCIERELSNGDKNLSFEYRASKAKKIQNEYYVETKDDRFVVKEVGKSTDGFPTFVCQLDLEDLEAEILETFSATDVTLTDAANLALAGTGWTVDTDITKKRSVATMKVTPLSALGKVRDAWMCEMRFDTKNKVVYFREQFGEDKGVFFTKSLNLRKLDLTSDSYDYYTRIIPIGADGLRINDVNGGKSYVENYQYSNKIRTLIWEDTNYEDAETLKEDAEKKLDDMSKPVKSYSADIVDLAAQRPEYSIMSFDLGDTILLLDEQTGIKEKQRIVKLKEYPKEPEKNSCELSNTTLTFEELQDRLEAAAKAVEDITNADGTVNGYYVHGVEADGIVGIEVVINGSSAIKDINEELSSVSGAIVDINGSLSDAVARIGTLETTALTATEADLKYATIEQLNVTNQTVHFIQGDYADFKTVTTEELAAKGALIENIQGDLANYKTTVTEELITAKGWMLEGAIGDAQISSLSANKIKTGTIDTALVTVASADGAVEITGNQIMVNDVTDTLDPVNRVIVGKYNADSGTVEYGLLVRGADGKTVMIDGDGVYNAGITDGAVDNNKVANDANIAGSKLDINSVVTEINGATEKISSTVVQVGDKSLTVFLEEQENILDEYGETLTSQAAQITANEENISLKVSSQEFTSYKTTVTNSINTAKTEAINTAAEDATEKANAAQSAAISAAAKDAQTKATAAQNVAISAAATDAAAKAAQALSDAKKYTDDEITVVNKSLSTATADISVLKNQISLKVEQTDIDEAVAEVNGRFASYSTTSQMNAAITAAKNSITSTVSQTYATKAELTTEAGKISALETWRTEASQKITKDGIISTVGNYYAYESDLTKAENRITAAESSITQQAAEIALTVKKDDVISSINQSAESVAIQASKIKLEGLVTANSNFKVLADGSIEAVNGKFTGEINSDSGVIGGLTINNNSLTKEELYKGENESGSYEIAISLSSDDGVEYGNNVIDIRSILNDKEAGGFGKEQRFIIEASIKGDNRIFFAGDYYRDNKQMTRRNTTIDDYEIYISDLAIGDSTEEYTSIKAGSIELHNKGKTYDLPEAIDELNSKSMMFGAWTGSNIDPFKWTNIMNFQLEAGQYLVMWKCKVGTVQSSGAIWGTRIRWDNNQQQELQNHISNQESSMSCFTWVSLSQKTTIYIDFYHNIQNQYPSVNLKQAFVFPIIVDSSLDNQ